jgi:Tyrosine phosphatase family
MGTNNGVAGWIRPDRMTLGATLMGGAAAFTTLYRRLFLKNYGVVDPGRVYRCARQGSNIKAVLSSCHPATILNLRSSNDHHFWRIEEMIEARRRGIDLHEVSIRYDRRPTREELLDILDVFDICRYPLLIHCTHGADRTGLASALYLAAVKNVEPKRALRIAFSLKYGHMPICGIKHLHDPIEEYQRWLETESLPPKPGRLRLWLERVYQTLEAPGLGPDVNSR